MSKSRVLSCAFGVAALALLLSASASATTLARQNGAFGIVTYDSISTPTVPAVLARQCGAFGIVTYDLPPVSETQTTPVPVPYAWLDTHIPGVAHEAEAYEAAAMATAANGRKVWECYVVGLDPQKMDEFKISAFPMKADGTPDFANVVFDPPKAQWNVPDAPVTWKGAATLEGPWRTVTVEGGSPGTARPTMQFYKAVVFGDADDDPDAHDMVQLWTGGPYWATTNIGAEEPWEYGYYFWWGDIVGYKRENDVWVASDESSSGFSFNEWTTPTCIKDNSTLQSEGWITADNSLAPEHDAAHVQWGGSWRMPTKQELSDLSSNCDWTWTTTNGVNGYVVRGRGDYASASIFLPAAGDGSGTSLYNAGSNGNYWSSVRNLDESSSWVFDFDSGFFGMGITSGRNRGFSVRPVRGAAQ